MSPLPQLAPLDASEASTASDLHALLQAAYTQEAQLLELDPAQFPPLQRRVHELQTSDEAWSGAWQAGELPFPAKHGGHVTGCPLPHGFVGFLRAPGAMRGNKNSFVV